MHKNFQRHTVNKSEDITLVITRAKGNDAIQVEAPSKFRYIQYNTNKWLKTVQNTVQMRRKNKTGIEEQCKLRNIYKYTGNSVQNALKLAEKNSKSCCYATRRDQPLKAKNTSNSKLRARI